MRIIDGKDSAYPKKVIAENERDGHLVCSCGHEYHYSSMQGLNMGEWFGYVVPICPKCDVIASSDTRRMDL